jgi:tripartite-type tricarboxylate transporter receptor subunit TctC
LQAKNLKALTGVNVVSINYKGGGAALMAVVSGETKVGFNSMMLALPYAKAGQIKAIWAY